MYLTTYFIRSCATKSFKDLRNLLFCQVAHFETKKDKKVQEIIRGRGLSHVADSVAMAIIIN